MTFLGFMCKWKDAEKYKTKEWVKVRAKVGVEYQRDYHGEGPVLYAENVEKPLRSRTLCSSSDVLVKMLFSGSVRKNSCVSSYIDMKTKL